MVESSVMSTLYAYLNYHRISGGELFEHLAEIECLTEEKTISFTWQMLEALGAVHKCNIVHLDVKVCLFTKSMGTADLEYGFLMYLHV